MISKDELRRIPEMYRQIQHYKSHLRYLQEKTTCVPSIMPKPDKVQTSPEQGASVKYIEAAVDLEVELERLETELLSLQLKAKVFIDTLEGLERKVMCYRYLKCLTWDETALTTGYTMRWVQQLEFDVINRL